jgi:hypothetical protein
VFSCSNIPSAWFRAWSFIDYFFTEEISGPSIDENNAPLCCVYGHHGREEPMWGDSACGFRATLAAA